MEYPIAELVDRYTILKLKVNNCSDGVRAEINSDLCSYAMEVNSLIAKYSFLEEMTDRLFHVNGEIWQLESDIRNGKEECIALEEIGRRALRIRELNKKRVSIKNLISEAFCGKKEIKIDHASV